VISDTPPSRRKKILLVTDRVPGDSSRPGAPRIYELCNALRDRYDFHLFLISSDEETVELRSLDAVFSHVQVEYFDSGITSLAGKLFRLSSPTASFDYRLTHRKALDTVRARVRKYFLDEAFDGIFIDRLRASQFVDKDLKKHAVIDFCDCLTKLHFRYISGKGSIRNRISNLMAMIGLFFWERSESRICHASCLVSEHDRGVFAWNKGVTPHIVPLGISTEYFSSSSSLPETPSLVFFGSLDYVPNTDACIWLAHDIFPRIRAQHPDATLEIVGAFPPASIRALESIPGIRLHADVPDIRPFIEKNSVCITPLRLGAGVKNKILVAMSMERPVVSSVLALEGLKDTVTKHILSGDTADEIAKKVSQVITLCSSKEHNQQLQKKLRGIRDLIRITYSWSTCSESLDLLFGSIPSPAECFVKVAGSTDK
jgi:glycosyltransferase involved in cell wall biosynthesis